MIVVPGNAPATGAGKKSGQAADGWTRNVDYSGPVDLGTPVHRNFVSCLLPAGLIRIIG